MIGFSLPVKSLFVAVDRLHEREVEMKKEYAALHARHTDVSTCFPKKMYFCCMSVFMWMHHKLYGTLSEG